MRRLHLLLLGLAPLVLTAMAFAALVNAGPNDPSADPEGSLCTTGLQKWVEPTSILLGDTAKVTLVVTNTCPATNLPIDLVFLVDESNSMKRGEPSNNSGGGAVQPGQPGAPTKGVPPPGGTVVPPPVPGPDIREGGAASGNELLPDQLFPPTSVPTSEPTAATGVGSKAGCSNDASNGSGSTAPQPGQPGSPTKGVPPPGGTVVPPPVPGPNLMRKLALGAGQLQRPGDPPPGTPGGSTPDPGTVIPPPGVVPAPGGGSGDVGEAPGSEDLIREVKKDIRDFLDQDQVKQDLDSGMLRVALASFNDKGRTITKLESNSSRLLASLNRLRASGRSRIDFGMTEAERDLMGAGAKTLKDNGRLKVVMLLSDGYFCDRDLRNAMRHAKNLTVIAVGMGKGPDKRSLTQLTTEKQYFVRQHDIKQLLKLYTEDIQVYTPVTVNNLLITDELAENMRVVPNSFNPDPTLIFERKLQWDFWKTVTATNRITLTDAVTVTYRIQPTEAGMLPISSMAIADWTDSRPRTGSAQFPNPQIEVIAPTATPTPTSTNTPTNTPTNVPTNTPTATNTPTPEARYLPYLLRSWPEAKPTATPECRPEVEEVDVVALVDTSDSMGELTASGKTKLQLAVDAVQELVNQLLPTGINSNAHIAIIGFNTNATTLISLSGDRVALAAALAQLPGTRSSGTFIDRGLQGALVELQVHGRPNGKRHVVLVTDGQQQDGNTQAVLNAAQAVKNTGTTIWAIGLGASVDRVTLRQVASGLDHYTEAQTAEELADIYRRVAATIPCPGRP